MNSIGTYATERDLSKFASTTALFEVFRNAAREAKQEAKQEDLRSYKKLSPKYLN